jgi:general secretion pathway protein G
MKNQRRKFRRHSQRGMTLIEIMVVLVILGMIAGAIGFNVVSNLKDANIRTAATEVKTLANAIDLYRIKKGSMPETLTQLVPGEVREVRKDPWQMDYVLVRSGGEEFEVISYGPDKASGGGDDISSAGTGKGN